MGKTYCGAKKVAPKGKKFGNMKECSENRQVRRYGVLKADPKIITVKKKKGLTKHQILLKKVKFRGQKRKLKEDIKYEKDDKKKKALKEQLKNVKEELSKYNKMYANT